MFNLSPSVRIFVCTKPVDMRRSFDGLFALVEPMIHQDAYSGHLFLFRSQRGNLLKILWWDLDGWAIFAKRLEVGTFQFPETKFVNGAYQPVELERGDLLMLLEGIVRDPSRKSNRYRHRKRNESNKVPQKSARSSAVFTDRQPVMVSEIRQ